MPDYDRIDTASAGLSGTGQNLEAKRDLTPWEEANERLAKQVSSLDNTVEHLEARLEGILYPGTTISEASGPDSVPEQPASPAVNAMRDHAARLGRIERRIGALRERIEV